MIKRSEVQWRELFEEHSRSGLSAAVFCREKKLCAKYFSLRRRQLSGEAVKPKGQAFVAARVAPVTSVIEVQIGLVRLRLPGSVPAVWLAELVRGLS